MECTRTHRRADGWGGGVLAPCASHLAPRTFRRDDKGLIDELAAAGVACVLCFPLRRLSNQQSETLERVATELADDVTQIAIPAQ